MARTGRPRGFDEQDVLSRARDLFWSRGYQATSVQDLVDNLALQRGSLYGAFGDKHAFYLQAVELYARENRAHLEALLADGPVLPALRHMLTQPDLLTGASAAAGRRGCMVGNTAAQLSADDQATRQVVAAAFEGFIDVVAAALRRGQADGEIDDSAPPDVQAQMLLLLFQGSALVSRAVSDDHRTAAAIDLALASLAPQQHL